MLQSLLTHDKWLVQYLLGWAGLAEPQPWGAAMSFALECAAAKGLIRGESDATLTEKGHQIAALICAVESEAGK
jgi:hypothetical protein